MEYGCIGEKLGHSFSKIIHNELTDYNYELLEIAKEDLDNFMTKADFKAINVTIPYKESVIPYLYEIEEQAKIIGAVNTVVNVNGKLYGYNTDFLGMTSLIKRAGIELKGKKVLILGSGGTSKTALAVAKSLGANCVLRVSRKASANVVTYDEVYQNHCDAEIIINTTPCGMYPNNDSVAIDLNSFSNLCGVVDAVYNPLNSLLVTNAKKKGIKAVGGLYMLVAQAAYAAEKFISVKISDSKIEEVYKKLLLQKTNAVLVGMPSCGKSTIGKRLSRNLSKNFYDTDTLITEKTGMSIPEIFEKYGEKRFREIESEVIREVSLKQNAVIATGGGAVLNPKNVDFLNGNGVVIFIDRPLENLITTSDRPLSKDRDSLVKLYNERYKIYNEVSNLQIKTSEDLESNIKLIEEGFLNEIFSS